MISRKSSPKKATRKAAKKKVSRKKTAKKKGRLTGQKKKKSEKNGAGEPTADRKKRARWLLSGLKKLYGEADCALHHKNAYQLLIATILSAQSTDVNVNKVTPELFRRYPRPKDLAGADPTEVEEVIRSTGFFRQKAKNIRGGAQKLVDEFGGKVPQTLEELTRLPGVARKTANVVLGTWFGKNEGVVVDTHVGRLAHRMGLTWDSKNEKDAVRIEQDLQQVVPRKDWTYFSHAMIWHGREVCNARNPDCESCTLTRQCPSAFSFSRQ